MNSKDATRFYDASVHARFALEVASRHGVPAEPLIAAAGLDAAAVAVPYGRVPAVGVAALLREVIRLTGDEFLGLHMAAVTPIRRIGIVGQAIKSVALVRESMPQAFAALRTVCNSIELIPDFEGPAARIEFRVLLDDPVYRRHMAEFHVAAIHSANTQVVHPAMGLETVGFQHAAPRDTAPYKAWFGCPVKFSQPRNDLSFDAAWLDRPQMTADQDLREALGPYVREVMAELGGDDGWSARVRAEALNLLRAGELEFDRLCKRLGMKERTLQHKLRLEGTSYSRLLDDARRHLALQQLSAKNAPVAEIAYLLGFEELGSFYRAFKRWTGTTPQAYREQHRPGRATAPDRPPHSR